MNLQQEFATILPPEVDARGALLFAVRPVPGFARCFVGKDHEGKACLLIAARDHRDRQGSTIRLENLHVQFDAPCRVRGAGSPDHDGRFTLIRCRAGDDDTTRYFLSACEAILRLIGPAPAQPDIADAIHRLGAIFRALQRAPTRSLNGLFGELFVIWSSAETLRAVAAWRVDDAARFDFSSNDARLDVKVAAGRTRAHTCSYEQCNAPRGTDAIAASLFVERIAGGMPLSALIAEIERAVGHDPELLVKLREVIAGTLGNSWSDAMRECFDIPLARASLRFFDLRTVPALRDPLPAGVSDVHFRSDFSLAAVLTPDRLLEMNPSFQSFIPRP